LKVQQPEDKKTKQLTLENLTFYKDNKRIPNSSPNLSSANRLAITFKTQKNGRKLNTITQWKTNDPILCPVVQWAVLVTCISAYNGASDAMPASAVWNRGRIDHVTSKMVENALCDRVKAYGEATLRIDAHKVGTHSIRSGLAMVMYMGGVPVFAIMMIGRWASDSFMKYIRMQIEEFTFDVSKRMLTMQNSHHTPNSAPNGAKTEYGGCAHLMLSQ
jgi:hypothetical protein